MVLLLITKRSLAFLCLFLISACSVEPPEERLDVATALGDQDQNTQGFERAVEVRPFAFPADHNAHPSFRNEWWYFTGNLSSAEGRLFGYQVTFFRTAIAPPKQHSQEKRASQWATDTVWMAHAAITDINGERHVTDEHFAREAVGLAGSQSNPFRVWLGGWQLIAETADFPWKICAASDAFDINLTVKPITDILLQGDRGLSQKSSEPGNASYYYSIPRLATDGSLTIDGQTIAVSGISWLDREWSTSALGENQIGWDWFSLQMHSGADLMFYQLRQKNGKADPLSKGVYRSSVDQQALDLHNTELTPIDYWKSPSGAKYPIRWRMRIPALSKHWIVEAALNDQLMETVIEYWEGAVRVLDAETNALLGVGYLEMTGY